MLEDGAWPEDVDAALQAFGFAMGPFAVADLSGLDIAWRMRRLTLSSAPPGALRRDPGQALQSGPHRTKGRRGLLLLRRRQAIEDHRQRRSAGDFQRRSLTPEEIQRRALLALVNETALLFAEGVASRSGDIDVVLVQGYGFPR